MTLKEARKKFNYSQNAIEAITGVPQSTISRLERNSNKNARESMLEYAIVQKIIEYEAKRNGKKE